MAIITFSVLGGKWYGKPYSLGIDKNFNNMHFYTMHWIMKSYLNWPHAGKKEGDMFNKNICACGIVDDAFELNRNLTWINLNLSLIG